LPSLRQKKTSFIFGLGGDVFLTRAVNIPETGNIWFASIIAYCQGWASGLLS